MNKKYYFFSLFLLLAIALNGQEEVFEITKVKANKRTNQIELFVKALNADGEEFLSTDRSNTKAFMQKGNEPQDSLTILNIEKIPDEDRAYFDQENPMKVLFLLDLSGSMRGEKLEKAKQAIKSTLDAGMLQGSTVEFAWFHDLISNSIKLTKANYQLKVGTVDVGPKGEGRDTDLHRAIEEKTNEMASFQGQKVIILLTDGKNDIARNELYKGANAKQPITTNAILSHVASFDSTLQIFPVGVGNDADEGFLRSLTTNTKNLGDSYAFGIAPSQIGQTFKRIVKEIAKPNYKISLFPNKDDAVFGLEQRTFRLNYTDPETKNLSIAQKSTVLGSVTTKVALKQENFLSALLTGLVLVLLVLTILSFYVPIYNNRLFKKKHIKKYKTLKDPDRTRKDPLTLKPFADEDEVVVNEKGDKMMKLSSWKFYKEEKRESEVGEFAELFQLQTSSGDFFSQRGAFKQLNWLWFGALGGFIAWFVSYFLLGLDLEWYGTALESLDQGEGTKQISSSIFNDTIVGVCMSIGIVGALATVEEIGQSRKFDIGRILLRMLIGILIGYVVFFLGSAFVAKLVSNELGNLIGWLLFGTAMGWVISLYSSIEMKNGLIGGAIAGLVAYTLYFLLNLEVLQEIFPTSTSRVISYIVYGAALGYTLYAVVSRLETFELLCLSPKQFSGWSSPISKWLKDTHIDYIIIGKHPKNRVYIKWEDKHVQPKHARLSFDEGKVYITPEENCEVLVNGARINGATILKPDSVIQLGRASISRLQFKVREKENSSGNSSNNIRSQIKVDRRSKKEVQAVRQQISIRKR